MFDQVSSYLWSFVHTMSPLDLLAKTLVNARRPAPNPFGVHDLSGSGRCHTHTPLISMEVQVCIKTQNTVSPV